MAGTRYFFIKIDEDQIILRIRSSGGTPRAQSTHLPDIMPFRKRARAGKINCINQQVTDGSPALFKGIGEMELRKIASEPQSSEMSTQHSNAPTGHRPWCKAPSRRACIILLGGVRESD